MTNKSKYVWLIQRSKLPLTVRPGLTRPFRLLMNLTARFCIISTLIMLVLVCGSQTTSAYSSTGLVTNPLFIFISCCYNCQKSLPRLHDRCKHERVYRRLMSCQHCHAVFHGWGREGSNSGETLYANWPPDRIPERSCQHPQRPEHRPLSRPHLDRCRPHWRQARGNDRTTLVPTVPSYTKEIRAISTPKSKVAL